MVDPQVREFLESAAALKAPRVETLSPREARKLMDASTLLLGEPPQVERVESFDVPGPGGAIPVRLVVPLGDASKGRPLPVLVFFHGGGWVTGSIKTHDVLCREIAARSGFAVASVDYRLAPEHPFPAAINDAEAATLWIAEHAGDFGLDASRIAVGGDSAGGNLAAVVALRVRGKTRHPLAYQLLIYPVTDCDLNSPSYLENAEGYMLTRSAMAWFWDQYVPDLEKRVDPDVSPLRAPDLSGLPPALVITAGFDPLRDEAVVYASKLKEAGVAVDHLAYPGMIHGFLRRHALFQVADNAIDQIAASLKRALVG